MAKIISIVGARPQFIKLGPLSREIRKKFHEIILHTGQHYDEKMSSLIFKDLGIPKPDYNLDIGSAGHGAQTGRMLEAIEEIMLKEKPDFVIVFGDTNSTLAGSLAAAKLGIKAIHIEAGLRSFNRSMPEEINRVVADHTADYLFTPTATAMKNLSNEGLSSKAMLTGDIMVDALKNSIKTALEISEVQSSLQIKDEFYLLTLHRPYNVDSPENLKGILEKLGQTGRLIVFPAHPRTKKIISENNIEIPSNIMLTTPLGYLDFLKLQYLSLKIITDSGGIQKEAYLLGKPCITLRSETEWIETIKEGWNILADSQQDDLAEKISSFNPVGIPPSIFGENVAKNMGSILASLV